MTLENLQMLSIFTVVIFTLLTYAFVIGKFMIKRGTKDLTRVLVAITWAFVCGYFGTPIVFDLLSKLLG